jgi:hypothetical protein
MKWQLPADVEGVEPLKFTFSNPGYAYVTTECSHRSVPLIVTDTGLRFRGIGTMPERCATTDKAKRYYAEVDGTLANVEVWEIKEGMLELQDSEGKPRLTLQPAAP